ncbi:MAG: DUF5711 family protein [Lachnospiraceae bacterium]|nr:DUF5711 family protein [Lachnospiraceae bacterium]
MSNIREYMKEKEKRTFLNKYGSDSKRINYKEKIRGYKLARFYRAILFILIVAGVSVAFYLQWRNKIYTESLVLSSTEIQIVSGNTIKNLGGFILQYSKDGISLTNDKGAAVWNQTYEMQEPRIAICQNTVAIADYNGSTIYVLDTQKPLGIINTNLPIRAFDVAANGQVLVALDDGNITWINLYSADGTMISNQSTRMNNSGYPVSLSVSPNGRLVGISFFYVADGATRSSVAFYNYGPVGQNVNNLMSTYNYADSIVPHLKFMNDDTAFAVSDDRIMFFSGNEKPLSIAENLIADKIRSVYNSEDYVGLVFHAKTGETLHRGEALYRLDIYDKKGVLVLSKYFDFEFTEIIFTKDTFIIYNELDLLICNINGTERFNGMFDKVTTLFMPHGSINRFIAVTRETIDVIEFK